MESTNFNKTIITRENNMDIKFVAGNQYPDPPSEIKSFDHSHKGDKSDQFTDYDRVMLDNFRVLNDPHMILSDDSSETQTEFVQEIISREVDELSDTNSTPGPVKQLACTKKRKNKIFSKKKNQKLQKEDDLEIQIIKKYQFQVRNTDTKSKVNKLRNLWTKGQYIMNPHTGKMIVVQTPKLAYLCPIFPLLPETERFRFFDWAFPLKSHQ
jgi:hypothetical protein